MVLQAYYSSLGVCHLVSFVVCHLFWVGLVVVWYFCVEACYLIVFWVFSYCFDIFGLFFHFFKNGSCFNKYFAWFLSWFIVVILSTVCDKLSSFLCDTHVFVLVCLYWAVNKSFRFSMLFPMCVESHCTAVSIESVVFFRLPMLSFSVWFHLLQLVERIDTFGQNHKSTGSFIDIMTHVSWYQIIPTEHCTVSYQISFCK